MTIVSCDFFPLLAKYPSEAMPNAMCEYERPVGSQRPRLVFFFVFIAHRR